MSDRTKIQRNKGDTSTVTNPSLASSTTPTLANPTHSFGLQSTIVLPETSVQALSNQQDTQSTNEQLPEGEVFKQQPQGHDLSRISLRPQAKLSTSQLGHTYEPEANWLADRKGGIIPEVLQRKCAACEEEEELQRRINSPIIQRDETNSLPPVPNYQLTPPSLLQPPDPATQYGLGLDLHLQLDPQLQAMQYVQQQLNPATIRPALNQINLGVLPTQGVTSPGTPNSTTPIPNPFASPTSPPAASPVPAGAGPDTPRAATAGNLVQAIMAVPAIDGALTSLQTQVGDRISQDWDRLKMGEQIGVVSSLVIIGGGALAGAISDPTARRFALDQLNGRMLPVPGLNWLHLEINTGGDNLMLGMHVDVGRLLPPSFGFGSSSPSAIGSPPQPQPLPGQRTIQRFADTSEAKPGQSLGQRIQDAASSGGSSLDKGVQQHLEQSLNTDLSGVQIHTGSEADRLSRSVNAIAFTTGQDIFFSGGSYNPSSSEGQHLIAHEVVHTVQQANGAVTGNATGNGVSISDPSDQFEQEAEQVADQVMRMPSSENSNCSIPTRRFRSGETTSISPVTIQRIVSAFDPSEQKKLIEEAIQEKSISKIKDVEPQAFTKATDNQCIDMILILLNQGWVGPLDEYAITKIWASRDNNLATVASKWMYVWNMCINRDVTQLYDLPELNILKTQFKQAVAARAKGYLQDNKDQIEAERKRYGLDNPNAAPSDEQTKNTNDLKKAATLVGKALQAKRELKMMPVIYEHYQSVDGGVYDQASEYKRVAIFSPDDSSIPPSDYLVLQDAPTPTWAEAKKQYERSNILIDHFTTLYPALYPMLASDGWASAEGANLLEVGGSDNKRAQGLIGAKLSETLENINKTFALLDDSKGNFALELQPIHNQFFTFDAIWSAPFAQAIARAAIKEHDNVRFWETMGLATLGLALFVVAEASTGGLATFFFAGAAGTSAAQAYSSWDNYQKLDTAKNTTLSKEGELVSQEQVAGAFSEAVLDTVFAFLDVYAAGKGAAKALKQGDAVAKLAEGEAKVAQQLGKQEAETASKDLKAVRDEVPVKDVNNNAHALKIGDSGLIVRCSYCLLFNQQIAQRVKELTEKLSPKLLKDMAPDLERVAARANEISQKASQVAILPNAERAVHEAELLKEAKAIEEEVVAMEEVGEFSKALDLDAMELEFALDGKPKKSRLKRSPGDRADLVGKDGAGQVLTRDLVRKVKEVLGLVLDKQESLKQAWEDAVKAVGGREALTATNYADLYSKAQQKFWQKVEANSEAEAFFTERGFMFPEKGGAPVLKVGQEEGLAVEEIRLSLDHIQPKATGENWQKALDADNLQILTHADNTKLSHLERKFESLRR